MFTIATSQRTGNVDQEHADRRTWAYSLDAETVRAAVRNLSTNKNIVIFINGNRVTV